LFAALKVDASERELGEPLLAVELVFHEDELRRVLEVDAAHEEHANGVEALTSALKTSLRISGVSVTVEK
jgi:hypothetical protein